MTEHWRKKHWRLQSTKVTRAWQVINTITFILLLDFDLLSHVLVMSLNIYPGSALVCPGLQPPMVEATGEEDIQKRCPFMVCWRLLHHQRAIFLFKDFQKSLNYKTSTCESTWLYFTKMQCSSDLIDFWQLCIFDALKCSQSVCQL